MPTAAEAGQPCPTAPTTQESHLQKMKYEVTEHGGPMSAERLKQEAALRAFMILAPGLAAIVQEGMDKPTVEKFNVWLSRFEDTAASRLGAIAESLSEALVKKFGPDLEDAQ